MTAVFADTYYYLALLNPRDVGHAAAVQASALVQGEVVTTQWVLAEIGDALAAPQDRPRFAALLDARESHPQVTIVDASAEHFREGAELYKARPDKSWSLTDCISFVVMRQLGLGSALTADRHFQQAGFIALLTK